MIKKNIQCKDCFEFSTLFVQINEELKCSNCNSLNIKTIYKPLSIQKDEVPVISTGELSQEYIDENKQVLEQMKKEKMIWKQ